MNSSKKPTIKGGRLDSRGEDGEILDVRETTENARALCEALRGAKRGKKHPYRRNAERKVYKVRLGVREDRSEKHKRK